MRWIADGVLGPSTDHSTETTRIEDVLTGPDLGVLEPTTFNPAVNLQICVKMQISIPGILETPVSAAFKRNYIPGIIIDLVRRV